MRQHLHGAGHDGVVGILYGVEISREEAGDGGADGGGLREKGEQDQGRRKRGVADERIITGSRDWKAKLVVTAN